MFMSLAGTQAAPSPAKFLVFLVKDQGAPVLVPSAGMNQAETEMRSAVQHNSGYVSGITRPDFGRQTKGHT